MKLAYIDFCVWIARVEGLPEYQKVIDAIHVAIAEHHNCQLFVTSDPHFRNLKIVPPQLIDLSKSVAR